jgi:NADPH:quinone reductase-like Zn-dependent oxidoreductase
MQALRFERFGGPLTVHTVPRPAAGPDEIVVAVRASSINPSDVKNVAGKMEGTTLPRTPGRDFAGVVVDGPADWQGADVFGTGGDIGFTRDGAHAAFIAVPVGGVARKPARLSFEAAGSVGVNFVTAWSGVNDAARLGPGETILVAGLGGVGTSVVQLARWMGARSIGVARRAPAGPAHLQPDAFVASDDDIAAAVAQLTAGRGVDVVYDSVGAPLLNANLAALAAGGRYVIIASAGERRASFDILDFYHKRLTLTGIDSRALDTVASARILERLRPGFESGALAPPAIERTVPLAEGPAAYAAIGAGRARGKLVLLPD